MSQRGGLVLCGGQSQRMGQAKAWLPFGPERLVQRVVRLLDTVVDELVVVAAPGQDLPELPSTIRLIYDPLPAQGPLRGLATGLAALPESVDLVAVTATDVPFLQPDWFTELARRIGDADLIVPRDGGRPHPLAAVYRRGPTLDAAERLLAMGQFRMTGLLDFLRGRVIEAVDLAEVDRARATLRNLNHPAAYRQALIDAGFAAPGD